MGAKLRSTDAYIAFADSQMDQALLSWAIITERLMRVGVIAPIEFAEGDNGENPYRIFPDEHGDDPRLVVSVIIKALGSLHKVPIRNYERKNGNNDTVYPDFDDKKKVYFNSLLKIFNQFF